MSKMRHFADEEILRLSQKPPGTREEPPAFSDMNATPMANGMNQSSVVCFPLISESRKFVWVHSHQIDSQIHGAAELDKAFDRFPYLTHRQTAELAESCHLHPDQVKAWFMAQRLHYGISWDYEDIREVQRKFNSSQEKKELQDGTEREVMEDRREKRKVKATGGNAKGRGVRGDSVKVNEQLKRDMKKEQPVKEKKSSTQKRKRTTAAEKMGKKIVKRDEEEMMDKVESGGEKCPKCRGRKRKKPRVNKSCMQEESNAPPAPSSLLGPQAETQTSDASPAPDNQTHLLQRAGDPRSTIDGDFRGKKEIKGADLQAELDHSVFITDIDKLKALIEVKNSPSSADPAATTRLHCKTPAQLAMMKMAFLQCQYPDKQQYSRLARLVGVPRLAVVQWFCDMRYFIKRGRPRWMNEEQHHQVLGNIMYQQYMNTMTKVKLTNSMNSWIMMLEGNKGYSEEKNMKIPPE
ncbi:homeobox and leucine zipper encoding b [Oreochromis niloticus]|uniref:homeobox and leucine zipper encoding b n=1 Tax=Oreochromis niloticus TaxID=8128 RepID=UPI000393EFC8|nr:homeobox and leucine zipper protein Homez [Oreochromis niloticus]